MGLAIQIELVLYFVFIGGDQKAGSKGKRQAWTAAAIEAFFEGLYQVSHYIQHV